MATKKSGVRVILDRRATGDFTNVEEFVNDANTLYTFSFDKQNGTAWVTKYYEGKQDIVGVYPPQNLVRIGAL